MQFHFENLEKMEIFIKIIHIWLASSNHHEFLSFPSKLMDLEVIKIRAE